MFRAQVCALLGFGLMLAAASTEARELNFLVDSSIGVDTNVFRTSGNRTEDGFWEVSPRIAVRDTQDTLEYDFNYRPTFQTFFNTSGINGWDHFGTAKLAWRPTKVDTISFGGDVISSRIVRQFGDGDLSLPPGDPDRNVIEETDRDRIVRSKANFGYSRSLNPTTSVRVDLFFEDIDFSDDQNIDSRSFSMSLGSTRVLDARTQIGLSATGRFRDGRGLDRKGQFSSETWTGDLSLSFARSLSPSITLSARVGPTLTRTEQNAPPFRDADPETPEIDSTSKDRNFTYVASVSLEKRWRNSSASLEYTRFESGAGGTSSASIVDQISLKLNHRPSRQLRLTMNATWTQRDTITSVDQRNSQDSQRYSVSASAIYNFSGQFSVIGRTSFRRVDDRVQVSVFPPNTATLTTDIFLGTISLRYTFDPIIF